MRDNSRRGAPRSGRAAGRPGAGRGAQGRDAGRGAGPGAGRGAGPGAGRGAGPGAGRGAGQGAGPRQATGSSAEIERLIGLIEPVLRAMDIDLEGVRIAAAGRRRVLRVVVDADGGVSLDEIAEVSRELSARLDARGAMGEAPYTLEVSSPGVERPLTEPRHWRRAAGRLVAVALRTAGNGRAGEPGAGSVHLDARIVGADDDGVTFDVGGERRTFGYADLGPGRVQVEFGRLGEAGEDGDEAADEEDRNGH